MGDASERASELANKWPSTGVSILRGSESKCNNRSPRFVPMIEKILEDTKIFNKELQTVFGKKFVHMDSWTLSLRVDGQM